MFRNDYDQDVQVWSPEGRTFQVEYAMEAVKQGSCCIGLRSKTHAVLVTLKRSQDKLGTYQQKVFVVDDHVLMGISGLTADARVLCKYMRNECLTNKYVYSSSHNVERLVQKVADKEQACTQGDGKRPYGVGILVIGYDSKGAHLFENCPSGNMYAHIAMGIGARSQAARTYLEKHFETFENATLDELRTHALVALRETIQSKDKEGLTYENTTLAFVGKDTPATTLRGDNIKPLLDSLEGGTKGASGTAPRTFDEEEEGGGDDD